MSVDVDPLVAVREADAALVAGGALPIAELATVAAGAVLGLARGDWWVPGPRERAAGVLYLMPPAGFSAGSVVIAPVAERLVEVMGTAERPVTGVSFRDGATYVSVGSREVAFSDIVSVKKPGTN